MPTLYFSLSSGMATVTATFRARSAGSFNKSFAPIPSHHLVTQTRMPTNEVRSSSASFTPKCSRMTGPMHFQTIRRGLTRRSRPDARKQARPELRRMCRAWHVGGTSGSNLRFDPEPSRRPPVRPSQAGRYAPKKVPKPALLERTQTMCRGYANHVARYSVRGGAG